MRTLFHVFISYIATFADIVECSVFANFLSLMFFTGLRVLHLPTDSLQGAQCARQSMDGATAPVNVSCVDT